MNRPRPQLLRLALSALGALLVLPLAASAQELTEERGYDRKGDDYTSFRSRGLRDCKEACRKDGRCQAYTFDTRNDACYLKDRINSKRSDGAMVTGYRERSGSGEPGSGGDGWGSLTEERGYDRKGNDYTSFRSRGLRDCKEACAKDRRCQAYTFDTRNDVCYLKDRINSKKSDGGMITGYRESREDGGGRHGDWEEGAGNGPLTEEWAQDRKGNDYTSFESRSVDSCKDSCRRDDRCRAYTYDTVRSTCYLKDRVSSAERAPGKVTGYKQQGERY